MLRVNKGPHFTFEMNTDRHSCNNHYFSIASIDKNDYQILTEVCVSGINNNISRAKLMQKLCEFFDYMP